MLPVFQPAPMKRWEYDVFKARPIPPLTLPAVITDFKLMPYSGLTQTYPHWFHTWK